MISLIVSSIVTILILSLITIYWIKRRDRNKENSKTLGKTVCLYQVGRGPCTPSLSPFPLKLETFLRMAQIPYMNDHSGQFSRKGKTPWMMYDGQRVEDSQLCLEFLKRHALGCDVNKGLTDEQLATTRAVRAMTEENLYWTMCYESFVHNPGSLDILLKNVFPWWKIWLFKKGMGLTIKKQLWGQGVGRHSDSEIWGIAQQDLRALSSLLGSKPFMLGESPHEVDCTVFGMLSMVLWQMSTTRHEHFIKNELRNLVQFCERMKDRFWPDWEQRCKGDNYKNDDAKIYTF